MDLACGDHHIPMAVNSIEKIEQRAMRDVSSILYLPIKKSSKCKLFPGFGFFFFGHT